METPVGTFRAGREGGPGNYDGEFRKIRRRVRRRLMFFRMLFTYVSVLALLGALELIFGWHSRFLLVLAVLWGALIVFRFLSVFVFDEFIGRDAERRLIEAELRKRESRR